MHIGYVVKRYPRFSETFIVNEIRAHEAAGQDIEIYSLRRPKAEDSHADVSGLRAPVTYLTPAEGDAAPDAPIERLCSALRSSLASAAPVTESRRRWRYRSTSAESAK